MIPQTTAKYTCIEYVCMMYRTVIARYIAKDWERGKGDYQVDNAHTSQMHAHHGDSLSLVKYFCNYVFKDHTLL